MLSFKNYLIKQEEAFNPINFTGGFATNLAGQGIKSVGNITQGVGKTAAGLVGAAGGVVGGVTHGMLGSKDNSKKSIDFAKKSTNVIGSGITDVVKGVIQLGGAVSLITPFLRGVQASAEPAIPRRFNRNRSSTQKLLGLNSSKETPLIILGIPKDGQDLKKLIEEWYEEAVNKREIQVKGKPEIFIKKLIQLYNSTETDAGLNRKIKYLLNTYFSNFEVIMIEAGQLLPIIDKEIFYSNSRIIRYIDFLHSKTKSPNVVLITQNNKIFLEELIKIYNNYLSSNNLILGRSSRTIETKKYMQEYKNKILEIVAKFIPNKKIKTKQ